MLHMYICENKAQLSQSPHQWHPLPRALLLTPHVLYCICNAHIRIHTSSSTLTPQSRSDRECDGLSGLSGPLTTDYYFYFYYWLLPTDYWLLLLLSQYWLLTAPSFCSTLFTIRFPLDPISLLCLFASRGLIFLFCFTPKKPVFKNLLPLSFLLLWFVCLSHVCLPSDIDTVFLFVLLLCVFAIWLEDYLAIAQPLTHILWPQQQ